MIAPAAAPKKPPATPAQPTTRALWGNGSGHFRTGNDYASATVRGTIWLTRETCTNTVVQVLRGVVDVYDIKHNVHTSVPAGQSAVVQKSK
jgi:ferric-dicitrate binding protein FerR (iron transport regulator)